GRGRRDRMAAPFRHAAARGHAGSARRGATMKLTRLDIQQLPGIQPGFVLDDLDPGINLVTGPNAIGKSSLIRALRYLVAEPAGDDPAALALAAEFDHDGAWSVTRTGRALEWRRNGRAAEAPPLP